MIRAKTGGWEDAFPPPEPETPMEEFGTACRQLHREIERQEAERRELARIEAQRVQLREQTGRAPLSNVTTAAIQRLLRITTESGERFSPQLQDRGLHANRK